MPITFGKIFETEIDSVIDGINDDVINPTIDQMRDPMEVHPESYQEKLLEDPPINIKWDIADWFFDKPKAPAVGKPEIYTPPTSSPQDRLEDSFNSVDDMEKGALRRMRKNTIVADTDFSSRNKQKYSEIPVLDMPQDVIDKSRAGTSKDGEGYEDVVDKYIASNILKKDDLFRIIHPDGQLYLYKYLGPNSGGRKDWLELKNKGDS